jgi:hypothetical protein
VDIAIVYKIINVLVLVAFVFGYPLMAILGLIALRRRKLSNGASLIWALTILIIPFLGALAIWIVNPQKEETTVKTKHTGKI